MPSKKCMRTHVRGHSGTDHPKILYLSALCPKDREKREMGGVMVGSMAEPVESMDCPDASLATLDLVSICGILHSRDCPNRFGEPHWMPFLSGGHCGRFGDSHRTCPHAFQSSWSISLFFVSLRTSS